ncbi:carboxypeptidase B [Octopus sinensis]|uniref:Carboxypeptidase B n=1 Tax=Octopus sinensis TaxID=2607531 RepID=A0A6P7SGT1_9MOLL|nr:carboxypeptidase B [Octopus sinensis]
MRIYLLVLTIFWPAAGGILGHAYVADRSNYYPTEESWQNVTYAGHQVWKILPKNTSTFDYFVKVGRKHKLDFWKLPTEFDDSFHIRVSPEQRRIVKIALDETKTPFNILIDDVDKLIKEDMEGVHTRAKRGANRFRLNSYQSTQQIYKFLETTCSKTKYYCRVFNIGRSSEGRDIKLIHLSYKKRSQRMGILIDAGMHGREWVSISVILHFINQLAINPENSKDNKNMLSNFNWYFIPILNPDGYEYTRSRDRLWRKTRSRSPNYNHCIGVDINRNFPNHWNEDGSSSDPCSVEYSGPTALSEPETMALANAMRMRQGELIAYISLHAYGQLWIYPWGYKMEEPTDVDDLNRLALRATNAIRHYSNTRYQVGSSARILYIASGASDDYAKANHGIKYAYTVELRDLGHYGFLLPRKLIPKTCQETFVGLKAFAQGLSKKSRRQRKRRTKRRRRSRRRRA